MYSVHHHHRRRTVNTTSTSPVTDPETAENRSSKDSRINLRVSTRQEQLIRRAALATDRSLTDFVLDSAAQRAEEILADRRWFILSQEDFTSFQHLLEQPLEHAEELQRFLTDSQPVDLSDL